MRPIAGGTKNTIESLLAFGERDDVTGCLNWPGPLKDNGYVQVCFEGRKEYLHRLIFIHCKGPLPRPLCALHRCDNRQCFEVEHLFAGTQRDNIRDMISKGREAPGKIKARKGIANGMAILTPELVKIIRAEYKKNSRTHGSRQLGRKYGICDGQIRNIVSRGSWKEVE